MKRIAIIAAMLVFACLLFILFPGQHRWSVIWLTPAEFDQQVNSPSSKQPPKVLQLLRQLPPFRTRIAPPKFDLYLETFKAGVVQVTPAGGLMTTNADGWQACVVPPREWDAFHHLVAETQSSTFFKPVKFPASAGGGSGMVDLNNEPLRHFNFNYKAEPAGRGVKIIFCYRYGQGNKTNNALAFTATIPQGGAVLLKRGADNSGVGDLGLLSLAVLPDSRPSLPRPSTNTIGLTVEPPPQKPAITP